MGIRDCSLRVWLEKGEPPVTPLSFKSDPGSNVYRFGWTNASYLCGLQVIDASMQEALKSCTLYENLEEAPVQNGVAT